MSIAQLVKSCPLFHEIYDEEIELIIQKCYVASYEPGDYIIRQGEDGTEIGIILDGEADICVDKGDQSQFIASLGQGDLFGELVLINETKRTANIICKKKCDVLIISFENFYSFYHKKPEIFSLMILNVTRLLTKRLKGSNQVIEDLLKNAEEKKAA